VGRRSIIFGVLAAGLAAAVQPAQAQEPAAQGPRPVQLIAFDGVRELASTSSRLGVLSQKMDFTFEIDAAGTATDCTLSRKFRSPSVTKQLCDILMRRSRLSPALDGQGRPTTGTYTGRIDFDMWIKPDR